MKWLLLASLSLLVLPLQFTMASCNYINGMEGLLLQTQEMINLAKFSSKNVMNVEINHDGSGAVYLYEDENGNFAGIALSYVGKDTLQDALTSDQLNQGKTISYPVAKGQTSPLVLSVKKGTTLSPLGGTFQVTILTNKKPEKKLSYDLEMKKVSGAWKIYYKGTAKNKAIFSPNLSFGFTGFDWKGTFSEVEFE